MKTELEKKMRKLISAFSSVYRKEDPATLSPSWDAAVMKEIREIGPAPENKVLFSRVAWKYAVVGACSACLLVSYAIISGARPEQRITELIIDNPPGIVIDNYLIW